jgi:hypothetical protein
MCVNRCSVWNLQKDLFEKELLNVAELEHESVSQLILHIKGEAHSVPVHWSEDIDMATDKVLTDFKLKPEMKLKIETELLRTKVDACHLLESKLKQRLATVQRQTGLLATSDHARTIADAHVVAVGAAYKQVDQMLPQFETVSLWMISHYHWYGFHVFVCRRSLRRCQRSRNKKPALRN